MGGLKIVELFGIGPGPFASSVITTVLQWETTMSIKAIDHAAVPINNVEEMLSFYRRLGFDISDEHAPQLYSVDFGDNKINFHTPQLWQSGEFSLRGPTAVPGCGDFCFVWEGNEEDLVSMLEGAGAEVIEGPVERVGGRDKGRTVGISRYIRDPDSNLLEFIVYP